MSIAEVIVQAPNEHIALLAIAHELTSVYLTGENKTEEEYLVAFVERFAKTYKALYQSHVRQDDIDKIVQEFALGIKNKP